MSRKDYECLAHILHMSGGDFKSAKSMRKVIAIICDWLQKDNPNFNHARFIEAVYNPEYYNLDTPVRQQFFFEGD